MRRTRMNAVLVSPLSDVLVTLSESTVCAVDVLGDLTTLAANAGMVSIVAASRKAAIFLFIVVLPSGHWFDWDRP